jgi:hypothetical protein
LFYIKVQNSSFISKTEASGKPFRSTNRGLYPATVKQKDGLLLNVYPTIILAEFRHALILAGRAGFAGDKARIGERDLRFPLNLNH